MTNVPDNQPSQPAPVAEHELSRTAKLKRSFFQILIGSMIGAAGIAVVAVLIGSFTEILGRALSTIAMVAIHAVLSLSYISGTEKQEKKDGKRSLELFSNTVFTLIVVSFITSVFAIWQLLDGEFTWRLYMFYFVILFATLHADVLYRLKGFVEKIDKLVNANYALMAVVVVMLSMVIFIPEPSSLGEFFYRLLAAAGIIDATMTITAVMMHKLYLQKHPELAEKASVESQEGARSFWKNPFVVLLMILLAFQVVGAILSVAFLSF